VEENRALRCTFASPHPIIVSFGVVGREKRMKAGLGFLVNGLV
jgi:hypothetical protein